MQAKLRCAKHMYATAMVTKSGTTMVAPVAPLPTALDQHWLIGVSKSNYNTIVGPHLYSTQLFN